MKPITLEGQAGTLSGSIKQPFVLQTKLVYITNDSGEYDLLVNFDGTTDENGCFTLKAGESVSDVPMSCHSVSLKGINGSVPFRIMGV